MLHGDHRVPRPNVIDVWFARHAEVDDSRLPGCERLLGAHERERHRRLAAEHRRGYLISRALLRTTLSRYAEVAPETWQLTTGIDGGIELLDRSGLHASLSRTSGLSMCAISAHPEIGVDVERVRSITELDAVTARLFAPAEQRQLAAMHGPDRQDRFYRIWTLKEAYLKARGLGMALPIDQLWFELDEHGEAWLQTSGDVDSAPASWRLHSFEPVLGYRAAVAARPSASFELLNAGDWFRAADPKTT